MMEHMIRKHAYAPTVGWVDNAPAEKEIKRTIEKRAQEERRRLKEKRRQERKSRKRSR